MTKEQVLADDEKGLESEFDDFDAESSGGVLYKWETPGQSVKGVLLAKRNVKTKLGDMTVYDVLTKDGEIAVPGTKGLNDQMKRIPADGSVIVGIHFVEAVKGNFPNPFKKFSVKYGTKTDARLSALGIVMFDTEVAEEQVGE